jgi:DNA-directed RNA polymerase beta' subunit
LNDLVISEKIFVEDKVEEFWFGAYETVYNNQFRYYSSGMTFMLDIEKLFKYKILMSHIKDKIESIYSDVCVVISPIYIGQLDIFIDTNEIVVPEQETLPIFLKTKNHIEIYLEEIVKIKLLEIEISGIKNIKNYHYQLIDNNWWIQTQGSNFIEILSLSFVDHSSITSNNMWDIFYIMGIEATREFLIEEFTNVVSSDGTFINPSHIILLVDIMTFQGTINSISRYGMKKEQMGVLSRASFEESLDQFCTAGFYSEKDFIKSVSANIMCGKRSGIGSGHCSLRMNWDLINLNKKNIE